MRAKDKSVSLSANVRSTKRTIGTVHLNTVKAGLLGVGGGDAELLDGGRNLRDGHRLRHLHEKERESSERETGCGDVSENIVGPGRFEKEIAEGCRDGLNQAKQ